MAGLRRVKSPSGRIRLATAASTIDRTGAVLDAERRYDAARSRLHAAYLRAWVDAASPLVIDLAALRGVELATALARAAPPAGWPRGRQWPSTVGSAIRPRCRDLRLLGVRGDPYRPRPLSGVDVAGTALALADGVLVPFGRLGSAFCVARRDVVELWLPTPIPDTAALAGVDRRLVEVVGHPAFERREYRVTAIDGFLDRWSIIIADAPALPFTWPVAD